MTTRNFLQQAVGYGATDCIITAALDGVEIYSGPIVTYNTPLPLQPGTDIQNTAFTWQMAPNVQGEKLMTISVSGSTMILADTLSDRQSLTNVNEMCALPQSFGIADPYSNVVIGGQSKIPDRQTLTGQWYWVVNPGETFQATLTISPGIDYPDWDPTIAYPIESIVVYNAACWTNGKTVSVAGIAPPSARNIWAALPISIWESTVAYQTYDRVRYVNEIYMALQNTAPGISPTDTQYWERRGP